MKLALLLFVFSHTAVASYESDFQECQKVAMHMPTNTSGEVNEFTNLYKKVEAATTSIQFVSLKPEYAVGEELNFGVNFTRKRIGMSNYVLTSKGYGIKYVRLFLANPLANNYVLTQSSTDGQGALELSLNENFRTPDLPSTYAIYACIYPDETLWGKMAGEDKVVGIYMNFNVVPQRKAVEVSNQNRNNNPEKNKPTNVNKATKVRAQ